LKEEGLAIEIFAPAHDGLVVLSKREQVAKPIRRHRHIVIHEPQPFRPVLDSSRYAGAESSGTAPVFGQEQIIQLDARNALTRPLNDSGRSVAARIVHDDHPPWLLPRYGNALQQRREIGWTAEGSDDYGRFGSKGAHALSLLPRRSRENPFNA